MTTEMELETLWKKSEGGFRGGILERIGERNNINPYHTKFAELPDSVRVELYKAFKEARAYFTDLCSQLTAADKAKAAWTFEFQENCHLMVTLCNTANERILDVGWNVYGQKHRYSISGCFPRGANGAFAEIPREVESLTRSITVADTKTPAQLARDIVRRLLPDYDAILAAVKTRIQDNTNYLDTVRANVQRLGTAFAAKLPQRPEDTQFSIGRGHSYYGHVRVSRNSCEINVSSLSLETAEKIAAILRESDLE